LDESDSYKPDEIYFVRKGTGLITEICKVCYEKDKKKSITTVLNMKSSTLKLFTFVDGQFYVMDESLVIFRYTMDRRSNKFK
jgi:hypothetical protein